MDVIASCGTKVGVVDHIEAGTIKLTKKDERTRSSEQIATDLRRVLVGLPGVSITTRASGGNQSLNRVLGDLHLEQAGGGNSRLLARRFEYRVAGARAAPADGRRRESARSAEEGWRNSRFASIAQLRLGLSVTNVANAIRTNTAALRRPVPRTRRVPDHRSPP
jgi:hypothetical protein